jgi:hypothetical protein
MLAAKVLVERKGRMKRGSPLKKAREACKWQGYEVAEMLGMYVIRYMAIEANCWEEPSKEEVTKIGQLFGMSAQELGLPEYETLSSRNAVLLEKGTVM